MDVRTLTLDAFFGAPPREVFRVFTDARVHSGISGGRRAEIEPRVGGRFSGFDGAITASFREIVLERRIVQLWRRAEWTAGHSAQLELEFAPLHAGRGAHVHLVLSGVPAGRADETAIRWRDDYWLPIAAYLRDATLRPARRLVAELGKGAGLDLEEVFAEHLVLHLPGLDLAGGRATQKSVARAFFEAFSDVEIEVLDRIVEGDRVAERQRATAVHRGAFLGAPATGRRVTWTASHVYRIAGGRIAEAWLEPSVRELLAQLAAPD